MMSANDNEFKSPEIEVVANTSIEGEGLEDVTELPYGDEAEAAEEYSSNQTTSYFGSFISKRNKVILGVTAVILVFCVAGFSTATARHNKTVSSFNVSGSKSPKSSKTPKTTTTTTTTTTTAATTTAATSSTTTDSPATTGPATTGPATTAVP